jgi:hypothetical protein
MLISYPRSGSTWLRFLLYEVLSGEPAEFGSVQSGIPGPAAQRHAPPLLPGGGRMMSAHDLGRHRGRTLYLVRDVRDVLLSEYRQGIRSGWFDGPLDGFVDLFLNGLADPFGSWPDHVRYWLDQPAGRSFDRLLVKYEELRGSPVDAVGRILSYLGTERSSDAIERAVSANTIDRMRKKEDRAESHHFVKKDPASHFVGKGLVGGWREELSPEQLARIEREAGDVMKVLGYEVEPTTE